VTKTSALICTFGRSPTPMSMARYRAIPEEGMNRFTSEACAGSDAGLLDSKKSGGTDLFGRFGGIVPGFTIRTEFSNRKRGRYLHPEAAPDR